MQRFDGYFTPLDVNNGYIKISQDLCLPIASIPDFKNITILN